jgi:hypothetical protein
MRTVHEEFQKKKREQTYQYALGSALISAFSYIFQSAQKSKKVEIYFQTLKNYRTNKRGFLSK